MAKKKETMKNEAVKKAVDKVGVRDPMQSTYAEGDIPLNTSVYTAAEVDALVATRASVADATLTPTFRWTYSGVPDGWIVETPPRLVTDQEISQYYNWMMEFFDGDAAIALYSTSTIDSNEVVFENNDDSVITATRDRTDIIGYQLGSQEDKPLAPAGDYAKKSDIPVVVAPSTAASAAGKAADAKATADALTERPTRAQIDEGWWSEWVVDQEGYRVSWATISGVSGWVVEQDSGHDTWAVMSNPKGSEDSTEIIWLSSEAEAPNDFTATRHRVAAPVPTKPEDIGAASTADATLVPVYSDTPTFSEWTVEPPTYEGENLVPVFGAVSYPIGWSLCKASNLKSSILTPLDGDKNATYLHWIDSEILEFTATRTRTDIIGYTLSEQTDKPLATAAQGAKADAAYQKPSGGIPVADLAPAVQTSLQKADDALSRAEAEAGFTEWEFAPSIPDNTRMVWADAADGIPAGWALETIDPNTTPALAGSARLGNKDSTDITWEASNYAFINGEQTYSFTTTRTRLPTMADLESKQNTITDLDDIRAGASAGSTAKETLQFKEWFPDGEVKLIDDCTTNLKFDWDNANQTNHTVKVLPFCNTGDSSADNSDKSGRVVIPPYVDHEGTRYKVTGVVSGNSVGDENNGITGIVAPTTVTSIGDGAFSYCVPLTSVSFPAVTSIGENVFFYCTSLATVSLHAVENIGKSAFYDCALLSSVDFGPDARQSVPTFGPDAFPNLSQSGHTCKIIVPDANYDAWTANSNWAALTSMGYEFVKWSSTQPVIRDEFSKAIATIGNKASYSLTTPEQITSTTTTSNDTISVTISDLSVNSITVPSSVAYVNIKFPEKTIGKARDFFIRLTITGSIPEITFKENDNTTPSFDVTDTEWANIGQGVNILAFIETSQS